MVSSQVEKVVAYLIRDGQVAVFVHTQDDDPLRQSGLQVPAGTCQEGEDPAVAVMREGLEETGLHRLRIVRYLGDAYYDMRPYVDQLQHRHFFHLTSDEPLPSTWNHDERDEGMGPLRPLRFSWLDISKAHVLAAGQGALLGQLGC